MQVVVGAVVGRARPDRVAGGDQPLVIEVRTAERGLEEPVRDRVPRVAVLVQVLVYRQGTGVIHPLGQADRVVSGHVPVLPPAVDLVLLLVEPVHEITCAAARQAGAVGHTVRGGRAGSRAGGRRRRDVVVDR